MGLTAIVSSSASSASSAGVSASVTSLLSPVGVGVGGIFVAGALVLLLAYLNLLDASERSLDGVRRTVLTAVVPLLVTFAGVVLFRTMQIL